MSDGRHIAVEVNGLDEILALIPDEARRRRIAVNMLTRMTLAVRAEAMRRVPKRTGHTARSIGSKVDPAMLAGYVGDIGGGAKTILFLEKGTGLFGPLHHRIYPRTARMMRWPTSGGGGLTLSGRHRAGGVGTFAFARSTKGMKAQPFLMPAWEATAPMRDALIERAASEVFREKA